MLRYALLILIRFYNNLGSQGGWGGGGGSNPDYLHRISKNIKCFIQLPIKMPVKHPTLIKVGGSILTKLTFLKTCKKYANKCEFFLPTLITPY